MSDNRVRLQYFRASTGSNYTSVINFSDESSTHFDQNLGSLNNYLGHDASLLIKNLRGLRQSYF
jgi:hypothetical protein